MHRWQSLFTSVAVCAAALGSAALGLLWFGHAGLSVPEQSLNAGVATWAAVSLALCLYFAIWAVRSKRVLPLALLCATPFVLAQPGVYLLLRFGQ